MALTVQNILDRAGMIIQDQTNVRWPAAELLGWLNDGRREIAILRPDIYAVTTTLTLVAGSRQTLPVCAQRLIDIPRNVSGAAVTVTQRGLLDQYNPSWHQQTGSATVKHFMFDERIPTQFWVYPPATTAAQLELIVEEAPDTYTSGSVLTTHEEMYDGALVDYICYRAFSKDSEYAGNGDRAAAHYSQFATSLKNGAVVSVAISPNVQNLGGAKQAPQG
jgi:hypothetical protein